MSAARLLPSDEPIPGLDGQTVADFWRWAYSDVLSNRNRSILAEFLVAHALGVADRPRVEWDSTDLLFRGRRVEVKSAAYRQSWPQAKPSAIRFSIKKANPWDSTTGRYGGGPTRCSDVYVFGLFPVWEADAASPLDVRAWEFFVVATKRLNDEFGGAKSLSLAAVRRVCEGCRLAGLRAAVLEVLADARL